MYKAKARHLPNLVRKIHVLARGPHYVLVQTLASATKPHPSLSSWCASLPEQTGQTRGKQRFDEGTAEFAAGQTDSSSESLECTTLPPDFQGDACASGNCAALTFEKSLVLQTDSADHFSFLLGGRLHLCCLRWKSRLCAQVGCFWLCASPGASRDCSATGFSLSSAADHILFCLSSLRSKDGCKGQALDASARGGPLFAAASSTPAGVQRATACMYCHAQRTSWHIAFGCKEGMQNTNVTQPACGTSVLVAV